MNFPYIGQKVVCVDDTNHHSLDPRFNGDLDGLAKGTIYTIREVGLSARFDDLPCVRVEEIVRPDHPIVPDPPYYAFRFRPVKTTDISIFTNMLAPTPKERETV